MMVCEGCLKVYQWCLMVHLRVFWWCLVCKFGGKTFEGGLCM